MEKLNQSKLDAFFLARCLELAGKGAAFVHPNPLVGCVIVRGGQAVGEGYHRRYGGAHAEINALKAAGGRARGATLYVNLEPCAHHGKTPPCVNAIVGAGVREVVVSHTDPNPLVKGRGIRKLREAGVTVRSGILSAEAARLNEKFIWFMKSGMPFVGAKAGQTLDGRIADVMGRSQWITSLESRREVHMIRSTYDAVLVGATTVEKDNPELTVRLVRGRNPLRIVVDPLLRLKPGLRVFEPGKAATLVITTARALRTRSSLALRMERRGVQVIGIEAGHRIPARSILKVLADFGITSLLIEGGTATLSAFFREGLVRKVHWFIAPRFLGGGLSSLELFPPLPLKRSARVCDMTVRRMGEDILVEGKVQYS